MYMYMYMRMCMCVHVYTYIYIYLYDAHLFMLCSVHRYCSICRLTSHCLETLAYPEMSSFNV